MRGLLRVDPAQRLTSVGVLHHAWLRPASDALHDRRLFPATPIAPPPVQDPAGRADQGDYAQDDEEEEGGDWLEDVTANGGSRDGRAGAAAAAAGAGGGSAAGTWPADDFELMTPQ